MITVAIVFPILALLALLTYCYFRHPRDRSSKAGKGNIAVVPYW